jgi:hypothetical protein
MAKLSDKKPCRICKEETAVLRWFQSGWGLAVKTADWFPSLRLTTVGYVQSAVTRSLSTGKSKSDDSESSILPPWKRSSY